ncbi:uncharacterized protein AMSG_09384 [Thecamonas trahens ATCC 50062]|uniref:ABC transporter domain-containing protein n=1 Tax=Thecamonas trahens ATCC 50062 TaxID=461836 RepID=A0A0L0DLB5_THETB|nr:hypothetical protein AMSG_09384 [Thecamonas trahens ATCC 50062]KNC53082.1 hypothetical protein AMSG_09384 [Thecamonas trahens ATCC 50062]|eukprot:XP_013754755.1 hypothetical protein AMSG_09384 [Thecamonas trahens ATCC 50062]
MLTPNASVCQMETVSAHVGALVEEDEDVLEYILSMALSDRHAAAEPITDLLLASADDGDQDDVPARVAAMLTDLARAEGWSDTDANADADAAAAAPLPPTTEVLATAVVLGKINSRNDADDSDHGRNRDEGNGRGSSRKGRQSAGRAGKRRTKLSKRQKRLMKKRAQRSAAMQQSDAAMEPGARADDGSLLDTFDETIENREAVAQVSRFHWETHRCEEIEVELRDVNIRAGDRDLLVNAPLRLTPGRKYGLVGRNGVGKSTLLRHIANGTLIGFPVNVRALYVEQEIVGSADETPLESVLAADTARLALLAEEVRLEAAVADPEVRSHVVALAVLADRAKAVEREARLVASKRSGARGKVARRRLLDAEAAYAAAYELAVAAAAAPESVPADDVLAEELLGQVVERLIEIEADTAEGRATKILRGLNFSDTAMNAPTAELSGGWRMRVALARALFMKPDLLMLDEPTNHLDLRAILWLQAFLSRYEGMLVVVSHDQAFLDAVATDIIVFRKLTLTYYPGNFSAYVAIKADLDAKAATLAANDAKKRAAIAKSIEYNKTQARKKGDDKRLKQVTSRQRKLDRMGLEKLESGKRYKKSYHGFREKATVDTPDPPISFIFPSPSAVSTLGDLIQVDDVTVGYDRDVGPVVRKASLAVERGSRIVLLGANGSGKSTLIKVIVGELSPWSGTVNVARGVKIGHYAQHHADALALDLTAVEWLHTQFPGGSIQDYRNFLGRFNLTGNKALQPMETLSGGEKARVVFATMMYECPHVLVIDEPSNHLDHDTLEALIEALEGYEGAVVLVSHDQHLLSRFGGVVYTVRDGAVELFDGGVAEYIETL